MNSRQNEIEQARVAAAVFDEQQEQAEAEVFLKRQEAIKAADKDATLSALEYVKAYAFRKGTAGCVLYVLPSEQTARQWCDKEKGVFALSYLQATDIEVKGTSYVVFDDVSEAANLVIQDVQRKGATYTQLPASELNKAQTETEREDLQRKGRQQVALFKAEADRHNYTFADIVAQIKAYSEQEVFVTKTFGARVRFKPSAMSVIVARSNRGKSKALKSIAAEAIQQGKHVAFFTLEELPRQVLEDVILSLYYDSVRKYNGNSGGDGELEGAKELREVLQGKRKASEALSEAIRQVQSAFQAHKMHVNDSRKVADIAQAVRGVTQKGDVVLIDYLQLASTGQVMSDKFLRVETVAQQLCALAKSTGIVLITAAQANRDGAKGEGGRVNGIKRDSLEAEHIRDSDAILHEADIVVGIGAEDSDGQTPLADGSNERNFFKVLKNRQERVDRTLRELDFEGTYAWVRVKLDDVRHEAIPFIPTSTKKGKE